MSEYLVQDTELAAVADAIRTKAGTTDPITFPNGFTEAIAAIQTGAGGSEEPYAIGTVTVKRAGVTIPGATVTAVNGEHTVSGVTDAEGKCSLILTQTGTYTVTVVYDGQTTSAGTITVGALTYTLTKTLMSATITVNSETGAEVVISKDGVTQTKIAEDMKAVFTVYSTGTYSVTSSYLGNSLTQEVNVTGSGNFETTIFSSHLILEDTTWEAISALSAEGSPENYFAIGDMKSVHLSGQLGDTSYAITLDDTFYVYILGFNHNAEVEGNGIHFGCFKNAEGKDIALVDGKYNQAYLSTDGITSNISTSKFGFSYGTSTERADLLFPGILMGNSPSAETVADSSKGNYFALDTSITDPKANTVIAVLPQELRSVLKKTTKYYVNQVRMSTHKFFVNALSEYEVTGTISYQNSAQLPVTDFSTYFKQYEYYEKGNSKVKYKHNDQATTCKYYTRDKGIKSTSAYGDYILINTNGAMTHDTGSKGYGLAPIFVV